jgi:hypothetical protein
MYACALSDNAHCEKDLFFTLRPCGTITGVQFLRPRCSPTPRPSDDLPAQLISTGTSPFGPKRHDLAAKPVQSVENELELTCQPTLCLKFFVISSVARKDASYQSTKGKRCA